MKHLYPLVLLALLGTSCGRPLQLVNVHPSDDATVDRYTYGNPILRKERSGVAVEANYYDASPDYLVFDVQVFNDSDRDVLFDPVLSSLSSASGGLQRALDPEFELLSLDWRALERQRTGRTLAWIGAGVLVAGTAYAIANGSGSGENVTPAPTSTQVAAQLTTSVADAMSFYIIEGAGDPRSSSSAAVPDPSDRFFWLDHSFRITTVRPGERAMGKLVFPREDAASRLRLSVGVGEEAFEFAFDQRVLRPGRDEIPRHR